MDRKTVRRYHRAAAKYPISSPPGTTEPAVNSPLLRPPGPATGPESGTEAHLDVVVRILEAWVLTLAASAVAAYLLAIRFTGFIR